jgi:filamentous hemagglutinin
MESRTGQSLDIKATMPGITSKDKAGEGFLFQGKYVTLRDAGNILYGINTANKGLSLERAMKAAGGYQQTGSIRGAIAGGVFGKEYGPAPYYGEDPITGTRIKSGHELAPSIPDNRPQPEFTTP